jgi:hypothetical protein
MEVVVNESIMLLQLLSCGDAEVQLIAPYRPMKKAAVRRQERLGNHSVDAVLTGHVPAGKQQLETLPST